MEAAVETQSQKSFAPGPRAKCTDRHGPFNAGSFTISRAGATLGLNLGTPAGTFTFALPRGLFLAALDEFDDRKPSLPEIEAAQPEAPAPIAGEFTAVEKIAGHERYYAAWALLTGNLRLAVRDAADLVGVTYSALTSWLNYYHRGELTLRRREAGFSTRPPSRRTDHDGSAPLLKPNGRIL